MAEEPTVVIPDYNHRDASMSRTLGYVSEVAFPMMPPPSQAPRVLDVGCGNGSLGGVLIERGYTVAGVDPSTRGIEIAREHYPRGRWELGVAEPGMLAAMGEEPFDVVTSFEVVEHVYAPRDWAAACFEALRPGGRLVLSTPYHGYLKNLAISIPNGWDRHFTVHWDGGHIKFWSRRTLTRLLVEAGFESVRFAGAGRLPYLWKSMVLSAERPR